MSTAWTVIGIAALGYLLVGVVNVLIVQAWNHHLLRSMRRNFRAKSHS